MPKKFNLEKPNVPKGDVGLKLPYHGNLVPNSGFSFSFASFDRTHKLFNLGDDNETSGVISGHWFVELMDCFKSVNGMTVPELKTSMHDLHPVDWSNANTAIPSDSSQCQYWQFRINKSKGRVIGVLTDGVFYVVWLDPHHNLTDSEGYGTVEWHKAAPSLYEIRDMELAAAQATIERLSKELEVYEELLNEQEISHE